MYKDEFLCCLKSMLHNHIGCFQMSPNSIFQDGPPYFFDFAPSGALKANVVAIINGVIFSFFFLSSFFLLSYSLTFLPEWVVLGLCNFAWAPKKQK